MAAPRNMPIQALGLQRSTPWLRRCLSYWPAAMLCALAALELLWGLGRESLHNWDEAIYAEISKEMVRTGDWLALHYEYQTWNTSDTSLTAYIDKPPLLMWSTAVLYRMFGIGEFWARATSACAGIGLVALTYATGKLVYDRWTGVLGALILLTSYHFLNYARFGTTDMPLTFFTFLALYGYLRLDMGSERWWYLIWIACALAVMVKAAGGLVAPASIALALWLNGRLTAAMRSRPFWAGLALAALIVAPWHIIASLRYGKGFIDAYFGHDILSRSMRAIEGHTGDSLYYLNTENGLQKGFFPWCYLVPVALAVSIKDSIRAQARSRVLLLLVILVFALYTVTPTKLPWYILPLYPALAVLVASVIRRAPRSYTSVEFGGLLVAACVAALIAPTKLVIFVAVMGVLVLAVCLRARMSPYRPLAFVVCAFLAFSAVNSLRPLYPQGESPVARLARIAGSTSFTASRPLIVLAGSGLYEPAPLFYSNRPIEEADSRDDLLLFTRDHQPKEILLAKKDVGRLLKSFDIHLVAEARPLVYATIRLKDARQSSRGVSASAPRERFGVTPW